MEFFTLIPLILLTILVLLLLVVIVFAVKEKDHYIVLDAFILALVLVCIELSITYGLLTRWTSNEVLMEHNVTVDIPAYNSYVILHKVN